MDTVGGSGKREETWVKFLQQRVGRFVGAAHRSGSHCFRAVGRARRAAWIQFFEEFRAQFGRKPPAVDPNQAGRTNLSQSGGTGKANMQKHCPVSLYWNFSSMNERLLGDQTVAFYCRTNADDCSLQSVSSDASFSKLNLLHSHADTTVLEITPSAADINHEKKVNGKWSQSKMAWIQNYQWNLAWIKNKSC